MSEQIFLDTSGLLCIHDGKDVRNAEAINLFIKAKRILTTNYILAEFVPLSYVRGQNRQETLSFIDDFLKISRLEIVWVNETLHNRAMKLLSDRRDKNYSLCDAVSFVVMREHGISEALTTDRHFEQEGFVKLLQS